MQDGIDNNNNNNTEHLLRAYIYDYKVSFVLN